MPEHCFSEAKITTLFLYNLLSAHLALNISEFPSGVSRPVLIRARTPSVSPVAAGFSCGAGLVPW